MNELLDQNCTKLEGIPKFIEKYGFSNSNKQTEESVTAHKPHKPKRPLAEVVEELESLKEEQRLVNLALETVEQLKSPHDYHEQLIKTLNSVDPDNSALEKSISRTIHEQWYDAAREEALNRIKTYTEEYSWPKKDFASLSSKSSSYDPTLRKSFETALELDADAVFEILAKPLGNRIIFHFNKSSDTAQKDKPEWLFIYLFRILELRSPWLTSDMQLLISEPIDRLITALLPALVYSCRTYVKNEPYMLEIIQCAKRLESEFWVSSEVTGKLISKLAGGESMIERFISDQSEIYSLVLSNNILDSKTEIDFDADVTSAKPTFAAEHVKQLLTDADALLRLDVFLVLNKCHLRVMEEYRVYLQQKELEAWSSNQTESVMNLLSSLCELYGSAAYMKSILDSWSVQLLVALEENSTIKRSIIEYGALRDSIGEKIVKLLLRTSQKSLKSYFLINWHHEPEESEVGLGHFQEAIKPCIALIKKLTSSSRADLARITGPYSEKLAELVYSQVVQGNVFTEKSAVVLQNNVDQIWGGLDLPLTKHYHILADSVNILKTGEAKSEYLSKEDVQSILGRRK